MSEGNPNHDPATGQFSSGGGSSGGGVGKTPRKARTARRAKQPNPRPMNDPGPQVAKAFAPPPKPASPSFDDLQKLINPGYGVKSYAPVGGGLKDPKPIDPAHVPPATSGRAKRTAARSKDPFAPDKHAQATSARLAQGISKKTPTMNVLNPERAAGGGGDKVSFKNLNATTLEKHNLNVPLSSDQEHDLRSHYSNFTKVSDKYSKEAIRHHNGNDITATHLKGANGDKYVVMTSGRNGKVYGIEHRDAAGNETFRVNTEVFGDVEDTERQPVRRPGQDPNKKRGGLEAVRKMRSRNGIDK